MTKKEYDFENCEQKELTAKEKFELYYDEYRSLQKEKEAKSLRESLKKAGLKKPPGNSQTPKK